MADRLDIINAVIDGMQEKKALDIVCLDLRDTGSSSADYFIVCHGDSTTQVDAIADSVTEEVRKKLSEKPIRSEGKSNSEWVLIDYFNVIVHIFYRETRTFYDLEGLWGDAKIESIEYQV